MRVHVLVGAIVYALNVNALKAFLEITANLMIQIVIRGVKN
jgi:hypothetical protein